MMKKTKYKLRRIRMFLQYFHENALAPKSAAEFPRHETIRVERLENFIEEISWSKLIMGPITKNYSHYLQEV